MNFSDLLDEDGQGTRELDFWLSEYISDRDDDSNLHEYYKQYRPYDMMDNVKHYTTGDSIDLIWELAKGYFDDYVLCLESHQNKDFTTNLNYNAEFTSTYQDTEQLAIAEALFKAYQKENE